MYTFVYVRIFYIYIYIYIYIYTLVVHSPHGIWFSQNRKPKPTRDHELVKLVTVSNVQYLRRFTFTKINALVVFQYRVTRVVISPFGTDCKLNNQTYAYRSHVMISQFVFSGLWYSVAFVDSFAGLGVCLCVSKKLVAFPF